MYKIRELAKILNVETVEIHKKLISLKKELTGHVEKNNGIISVDAEGLEIISLSLTGKRAGRSEFSNINREDENVNFTEEREERSGSPEESGEESPEERQSEPLELAEEGPKGVVRDEAPESPRAAEAPEAPEVPESPRAAEAPEAPEAPESPRAVEAPEVPESLQATEAPEVPESLQATEAPEAPEAPEVPEMPELPEQDESSMPEEKEQESRVREELHFAQVALAIEHENGDTDAMKENHYSKKVELNLVNQQIMNEFEKTKNYTKELNDVYDKIAKILK